MSVEEFLIFQVGHALLVAVGVLLVLNERNEVFRLHLELLVLVHCHVLLLSSPIHHAFRLSLFVPEPLLYNLSGLVLVSRKLLLHGVRPLEVAVLGLPQSFGLLVEFASDFELNFLLNHDALYERLDHVLEMNHVSALKLVNFEVQGLQELHAVDLLDNDLLFLVDQVSVLPFRTVLFVELLFELFHLLRVSQRRTQLTKYEN